MIREDRMDQVFKTRHEKVPGGHPRHPGLLRARPAGPGGHHLDRELRGAVGAPEQGQAAAPGAQRQAACARGGDRGAGRPAEDGHHRHQHGGPRHRHRAGRQPGAGDQPGARRREPVRGGQGRARRRAAHALAGPAQRGGRAPAACTSSAPSGTSRAGSTTSCAAARAARATPARAASTSRWRTRCCASSPPIAWPRSWTG